MLVSGHEDGSIIAFWPLLSQKSQFLLQPSYVLCVSLCQSDCVFCFCRADYNPSSAQAVYLFSYTAHLALADVEDPAGVDLLFFSRPALKTEYWRADTPSPFVRVIDLRSSDLSPSSVFRWAAFGPNPTNSRFLSACAMAGNLGVDRQMFVTSEGPLVWTWADTTKPKLLLNAAAKDCRALCLHNGRIVCLSALGITAIEPFADVFFCAVVFVDFLVCFLTFLFAASPKICAGHST